MGALRNSRRGRVIGATCCTGQKITTQSPGTPEAQEGRGTSWVGMFTLRKRIQKKAVEEPASNESGRFLLPLPAFPPPQSFSPNGFSSLTFATNPTTVRVGPSIRGQQFRIAALQKFWGPKLGLGGGSSKWIAAPQVPLSQVHLLPQKVLGTCPGAAATFPTPSGRKTRAAGKIAGASPGLTVSA